MNVPQAAVAVAKPNGSAAVAQPSYAELLARIADLEKQASQPKGSVEFSIAEKGGVKATGFGRFPTTLYAEQWLKLIEAIESQNLRDQLATWLSQGKILLKGAKDETAASILARSVAMGQAMLTPASVAQPVAK